MYSMSFHTLLGVLEGDKPFNTALIILDDINLSVNVRRAEKFYELENDFRLAWDQVRLEQAKVCVKFIFAR